jgi:hypothetical protein
MIPVRVAQEKNTRNAAGSIKRRRCGPHRMVTKIVDLKTSFFYAGICEDFESARQALLISNRERNVNEIIFVVIAPPADVTADRRFGAEFLGLDYYIDGYGSIIRLGIFTKPEVFPEAIEALNLRGLFDTQEDLKNYLRLYAERCRHHNLEIIDSEKMNRSPLSVCRP